MAAQVQVLRRRIRTVKSTKKIAKAQELVATSRIAKAQERVAASKPYAEALGEGRETRETVTREVPRPTSAS